MNLSWLIPSALCIIVCSVITFFYWKRAFDGGAQLVVTVGVLFTFGGIAYGLYNFDTNTANMVESINTFLDGMKTAFYTSIIGMGFGIGIKIWIQPSIERSENNFVKGTLEKILSAIEAGNAANDNSNLQRELGNLVTAMETFAPDMKNLSAAMNAQSESLSNLSATLAESIEAFGQSQAARLDAMKNSIELMQHSSAQAQKSSAELLDATKNFQRQALGNNDAQLKILSDNTARLDAMKNSIELMQHSSAQAQKSSAELLDATKNFQRQALGNDDAQLKILSDNAAQIDAVQNSIALAQKNSAELLDATKNFQRQALDNDDAQLKILSGNTAQIVAVKNSIVLAQKNSADLLDATKNFQRQALGNDDAQLKILSDNTAQIVAMKNSFDSFMRDVAKNFSENFIAALNESIKNLNVQLQTQFGENFKELNAAVREVVTWQREYKNIVELTTAELKVINETFNREILNALQSSLKIFSDTSAANISVQQELYAATAQLSKVISQADESINQMQTVTENFGKFSEDALNKNLSLLRNYLGTLDSFVKIFAAEVKKINSVAQSVSLDTQHYLKDFNDTSAKSMEVIRKTIASFKADLNKETGESLSNLHRLFVTVAKNTDEQSGKAIQNLAAALAVITEQMVSNYKVIASKIAEVDALLLERRRAG